MSYYLGLVSGAAIGAFVVSAIATALLKFVMPKRNFWSRMIYGAPIGGVMACFISYFGSLDGTSPGSEYHLSQWVPMAVSYVISAIAFWFIALFVATPTGGKKVIHTSETDD